MPEIFFKELCLRFTGERQFIQSAWQKVILAYTSVGRFYHDLSHIVDVLSELQQVQNDLQDQEACFFAAFYHDIVYEALSTDNEEKSALFATTELKALKVPLVKVNKCVKTILATKDHQGTGDNDINYFIDCDLAILGKSRDIYEQYKENIRKEYASLPDHQFISGRKKMLQKFLLKDRIYLTERFLIKYEKQGRNNLQRELNGL